MLHMDHLLKTKQGFLGTIGDIGCYSFFSTKKYYNW